MSEVVEDRQEKISRVSKGIQEYLNENGCILRTQTIIEGATVTSRAFVDLAQQAVEMEQVEEVNTAVDDEETVALAEREDTLDGN